MNRNRLFLLTRWRLAGMYAGVMGLILTVCGLAYYEVMAREHWNSVNRQLESVAGTLHDGIEPALEQPGQITPIVDHFVPGIVCVPGADCPDLMAIDQRHIAGDIQQDEYYIRFLDFSGNPVASAGRQPASLPVQLQTQAWQTLQIPNGSRYRQISMLLKTRDRQPWGYMQVGQSLREYDDHLIWLRWVLLLGLPTAMLLVSSASWWLSGLAMQPVYQSYRQVQQFTADAAHELRTPLAAIRATVESTLQAPLTLEEARSTLQTVERQNLRLSQLVQDLLLLSRMDLLPPLKHQLCCLNDLVSDLVEEFGALAIAADLKLKAEIRALQPLQVLGNEEQLYRMVTNLIINAIQYTPIGGQVVVVLDRDDAQAVVQVQDTGIGIALEEQARIFDRFYRVSSDRSRQTGGAGLGLAIAQAIAQAHQGSIQVQSELGQGSTFTVRLPLKD